MILNLILRLTIWFLLTADLSLPNLIIGGIIAVIFPHSNANQGKFKEWLKVLKKVLIAIPQAYLEAVEIMFFHHQHEEITMEKVKPERSSALIFFDIFLITFTPKTIVLKYHQKGWYEVHLTTKERKS
jgi:multicomponent Na+:H+ antiporter subunit E